MRLRNTKCLALIASLICGIIVSAGWGGLGACLTHHAGALVGSVRCSCSSTNDIDRENHCDEGEKTACNCACSIDGPAIPASSENTLSFPARTVAMEAAPLVVTVSTRSVVSRLISSEHDPPSLDMLRSVILLI